jgi:hypothetical protein
VAYIELKCALVRDAAKFFAERGNFDEASDCLAEVIRISRIDEDGSVIPVLS